jgi:anti-sigma factor RsiW
MHQPIKDGLEEYLRDPGKGTNSREFDVHLAACSSCAQELRLLEAQTLWLRLLQDSPAANAEPGPGFYARVLDRIEQETPRSIWSILLQPAFGRRIAVASGALALVLGTYLVSTEPGEMSAPDQQGVVISQLNPSTDRDAVLVNLASYHERE